MKNILVGVLKKELPLKEEEIYNLIEIPPAPEMGDYSFPCFSLAKIYKKSPQQIAIDLKGKLTSKLPKEIESMKVEGAYLNFFINKKIFAENVVNEILLKKDNFGKIDLGKGQKALIEHTSINPNASPHVGRVRNAVIGDSIVRILRFVNFKPEVHYYVNDVSKQIAMLVLANADKLKFEAMLKKYVEISKKVKDSEKIEKQVFDLLLKFEDKDPKIMKRFKKITDTCVKGQVKILSQLGINYDFFDYESNYIESSKKILEELQKTKKLFKDEDKRLVLDQKGTPVESKMKSPVLVLTRGDGTGLYPIRDIAYTIYKMNRIKKNMIVLGEDQKLYFEQLSEVLKLLCYESPEVIHYSFILLKENGKSKKMSTRKGDVVLLEDFLNEAIEKAKREIAKRKTKGNPNIIGIGAVKYSILKTHSNKSILFDLDEALSFEGDTGPYIQYSYARASSILRKAKIKSPNKKFEIKDLEGKEFELVKKLSDFQEIVLKSYANLSPSHIANYSYQLAQIFNEFYHECPVINSKNEKFRISLVESFRYVIKTSLSLLGIDVLEKM